MICMGQRGEGDSKTYSTVMISGNLRVEHKGLKRKKKKRKRIVLKGENVSFLFQLINLQISFSITLRKMLVNIHRQ